MFFIFVISSIVLLSACSGITPTTYTITATAGIGGNISPSGGVIIPTGADQNFNITPNDCYEIDNVLVDGISSGPISSYTFTDIQEDHTIQASFTLTGLGVHNKTTEANFATIQAAIDASSAGDTLIVCPGTYYENIVLDNKNITLRSTDPSNPSTVEATIIRATARDSVVKFTGGDTSTLEGFKITNGNAGAGGGINVVSFSSNPTIANNTITGNTASSGGGIFVNFSSPVIRDNTIINNTADYEGGGIYAYGGPLIIEGNTIIDNMAGNYGGGLYFESCSPTVTGNTISHNEATNKGGGIATYLSTTNINGNQITGNTTTYYGGGIFLDSGSVTISDNNLEDNSANYGGGIHVDHSSPTITNNTMTDNSAKIIGGGIFVSASSSLLPDTIRLTGWGTLRENIPTIVMTTLLPVEGTEYTIAGNTFLGNEQGTPLDYTEGAHVYFF